MRREKFHFSSWLDSPFARCPAGDAVQITPQLHLDLSLTSHSYGLLVVWVRVCVSFSSYWEEMTKHWSSKWLTREQRLMLICKLCRWMFICLTLPFILTSIENTVLCLYVLHIATVICFVIVWKTHWQTFDVMENQISLSFVLKEFNVVCKHY